MKPFCSILAGLFLFIYAREIRAQEPPMQIDQGKSVRPAINQLHPPQPTNVLKSTWSTDQKLDSSISEIRDINAGRFVFTEKYEYIYDDLGRCNLLSYFRWNQTAEQWADFAREEYSYNSAGNQISSLSRNGIQPRASGLILQKQPVIGMQGA